MNETANSKKKALFLYSSATGRKKKAKRLDAIVASLSEVFDLSAREISSMEEGIELAKEACGVYHSLIVYGGDGTLNHIASALINKKDAPILGYLPGGTLNDGGKNFGAKSLSKAMKIIKQGNVELVDAIDCGGFIATYMTGIGAFMDVSYVASRKAKKTLGWIDYYLICIKEMFHPHRHKVSVTCDGKKIEKKVAILALMNGKYLAGLKFNSKSSIKDGRMELFLIPCALFNGFFFIMFRFGFKKIVGKRFEIECEDNLEWCYDGEKGEKGSRVIEVVPSALKIYSSPEV